MDIFNGNKKLEEVIFDGLDYALYSRHDIREPFVPFMMLHKDGDKQLVRLAVGGDPNAAFSQALSKLGETYDYIVTCCEGRIPHGDTKQDAVLVKGFDTRLQHGFLFGQRFQGIESGGKFKKMGNPALLSRTEPLPVPRVDREEDEEYDEAYVSGMIVKSPKGLTNRVIIASHQSASVLSPLLFDVVTSALQKAEPDFSGEFLFNFVPDSLENGGLNRFILEQLYAELLSYPSVQQWESRTKRQLNISLEFNDGKGPTALDRSAALGQGGKKSASSSGSGGDGSKPKPWWKFW